MKRLFWSGFLMVFFSGSLLCASQFMVSSGVGQSSFSSSFGSATSFQGKVGFLAREGFSLEGTGLYLEADAEKAGDLGIKMVPVLGGINYMLPLKSPVKPYVGVLGGFTWLSSAYDSPAVTVGAKAGFFFRVSHDFKLYVEASQLSIAQESDNIEMLTVLGGVSIAFGGGSGRKEMGRRQGGKKKFRPVRRPRPKGSRRSRR